MATPFESALLNLKLFDLRRESRLREARAWFVINFNPTTLADILDTVSGERNADFRMVLSYWETASSLVSSGAIDSDSFLAANGEIFVTFSKIEPFLQDLRNAISEQSFCKHIESTVMTDPQVKDILRRRREANASGRSLSSKPAAGNG